MKDQVVEASRIWKNVRLIPGSGSRSVLWTHTTVKPLKKLIDSGVWLAPRLLSANYRLRLEVLLRDCITLNRTGTCRT